MMQLAKIFQAGMVLQREKPVVVWGTAEPGEEISVTIQGLSAEVQADEQGNWTAVLSPLHTSEQEAMTVSGANETLSLTDVAVGEVWIAGGQSNMEFYLRFEKHFREKRPDQPNPRIRFFDVPEISYDGQEQAFDYSRMGFWRKAVSAEDMEYFSAVGYYFEKELEQELNIPIGIVGCNWGGTASVAWMSPESAERTAKPWVEDRAAKFAGKDMAQYWANANRNPMNDTGNPFADPFADVLLGSTPTAEEIAAQAAKADPIVATFAGDALPQLIPGCLYEHMVKTIAPYTIRGVLWYQGESDEELGRQELYEGMLAAVIADWRKLWADENLPFLVVQLPGWESWNGLVNSGFPILRRCQQAVVDGDENLYLCSISDAGAQFDIHPKDKKVVGKRLALLALGHIYGRDILCDAPCLNTVERSGNQITLTFSHAEGGLSVQGEEISALSVTHEKKCIPFKTAVEQNKVVITLLEPKESVQIDFAQTPWYKVNLYNQSNIPAIPFSVSC